MLAAVSLAPAALGLLPILELLVLWFAFLLGVVVRWSSLVYRLLLMPLQMSKLM